MKKIISIAMTLLCIFSNCTTKAYEIILTPDGGKKVICKYEDLPWLIEQYENTIQGAESSHKSKKKLLNTAADVIMPLGIVGSVVGAGIAASGFSKPKAKKSVIATGIGVAAVGILAAIGAPTCASNVTDSDSAKLAHLESHKSTIEATKKRIDHHIAKNLCTKAEIDTSFRYTLFIDKQGFVYRKERVGATLPYEVVELGKKDSIIPKYKLDICENPIFNSN